MGQLLDGRWTREDAPNTDAAGRFVRSTSSFRACIERDPRAPFPARSGRYHLYASWACPWAHRVLIVRRLRRLEDVISVAIPRAEYGEEGWEFVEGDGAVVDRVNHIRWLHEIYTRAGASVTGRVTVPVLWDSEAKTVVNNESREMLRMLDEGFADFGDPTVNFRPPALAADIDRLIDEMYDSLNNGVYRAGFARSQAAYDDAVRDVFRALDSFEARLGRSRYLLGDAPTEADWCLFPTLWRFDLVYHQHFRCNLRRLVDYPNLWAYTRDLHQLPGVAETCFAEYTRNHYFRSHESINPRRIVPIGPDLDFRAPHGRERLSSAR